jgi:hypothetical protein
LRRSLTALVPTLALGALMVVSDLSAQSDRPSPAAPDTALISGLKADLRLLIASQDAYLAQHAKYASSTEVLGFHPASGATLRFTLEGQPDGRRHGGWSATITSALRPGLGCGIYVDDGTAPNAAVMANRTPACWWSLPNGTMVGESAPASAVSQP